MMIWTSRASSSNKGSNRQDGAFRYVAEGDLAYLAPARLLDEEGVALAFSLRHGGCSPVPFASLNFSLSLGDDPENVRENRRRLLVALGLPLESLALVKQVHSADIRSVKHGDRFDQSGPDGLSEADGLITQEKGTSLTVLTADCLPVVLVCREGGPIACIHAGRKGLEVGIVRRAVLSLRELGAEPEKMTAFIGPGIRGCCYEVGEPAAAPFREITGALLAGNGSSKLDLATVVFDQLQAEGVSEHQVADSEICTSCRVDDFFSYRREGGLTGRQATIVCRVH